MYHLFGALVGAGVLGGITLYERVQNLKRAAERAQDEAAEAREEAARARAETEKALRELDRLRTKNDLVAALASREADEREKHEAFSRVMEIERALKKTLDSIGAGI